MMAPVGRVGTGSPAEAAVAAVRTSPFKAVRLASAAGAKRTRPAPTPTASPSPTAPSTPAPAAPWFSVLQPADERLGLLAPAGVRRATLSLAWDRAEPSRGAFDPAYVEQVRTRYRLMRSKGLEVVLTTGLQYPPAWVFGLSPSSRFTNQHGDRWSGPVGDDVADGVFDPAVRAAQGRYLDEMARRLGDLPFAAVRVGGSVRGELHYPVPAFAGRTNAFWAFSPAALAQSPVPAWRPGQADPAAAARFAEWYLQSLTDYGRWLLDRARTGYPGAELQVLMPSWGLRPGDVEGSVRVSLDGTSRGERTGSLNEGLDWARQAQQYAGVPGVQLYTTWLDAADQGTSTSYESPVRHLVRLAAPLGLRVSGENTGQNDLAAMQRCVERVRELGLTGMAWMREPDLHGTTYATLSDFSRLIAAG